MRNRCAEEESGITQRSVKPPIGVVGWTSAAQFTRAYGAFPAGLMNKAHILCPGVPPRSYVLSEAMVHARFSRNKEAALNRSCGFDGFD